MGLERRGLAGKGETGKSNAKASKNEKKPRQDCKGGGKGDICDKHIKHVIYIYI